MDVRRIKAVRLIERVRKRIGEGAPWLTFSPSSNALTVLLFPQHFRDQRVDLNWYFLTEWGAHSLNNNDFSHSLCNPFNTHTKGLGWRQSTGNKPHHFLAEPHAKIKLWSGGREGKGRGWFFGWIWAICYSLSLSSTKRNRRGPKLLVEWWERHSHTKRISTKLIITQDSNWNGYDEAYYQKFKGALSCQALRFSPHNCQSLTATTPM